MNRINMGTTLLLGCTFGSAGISSYYLGQVLLHTSSSELYWLLGFGLLYPLLALILANLSELVKKIVLFVSATMAIVGSYFLMLGSLNTVPVLKLDFIPAIMYFMAVSSHMVLFLLGATEVLRRTRDAGFLWQGAGLAIGFVLIAIIVVTGMYGWLYMIMVVNYVVPVAILVYFLLYPEGAEGETTMRKPQTKEVVGQFVVLDTWKGGKIALYTLIVAVGVIATAGVSGISMPLEDTFTMAPLFWSLAAAGAVAASVVAKLVLGKVIGLPSGARKLWASNVVWLVLACAQAGAVMGITTIEFYVPGYHLSTASSVIGGLVLGFNIGAYFAMLSVQHPPRSNYAFYMFNTFFVIFAIVVSSYLRTINVNMADFYDGEITQYVIYVIAAAALVLILLVVNQIITIVKTSKAARDAPSVATTVA